MTLWVKEETTTVSSRVLLVKSIRVIKFGNQPQSIIALSHQHIMEILIFADINRKPKIDMVVRKEECRCERINGARYVWSPWGRCNAEAEVASQQITRSATRIPNIDSKTNRDWLGRILGSETIANGEIADFDILNRNGHIGAFDFPIRGEHAISSCALAGHNAFLSHQDLILHFVDICLSAHYAPLQETDEQQQSREQSDWVNKSLNKHTPQRLGLVGLCCGGWLAWLGSGLINLNDARRRRFGWALGLCGSCLVVLSIALLGVGVL
jgi:hypothetical protein